MYNYKYFGFRGVTGTDRLRFPSRAFRVLFARVVLRSRPGAVRGADWGSGYNNNFHESITVVLLQTKSERFFFFFFFFLSRFLSPPPPFDYIFNRRLLASIHVYRRVSINAIIKVYPYSDAVTLYTVIT